MMLWNKTCLLFKSVKADIHESSESFWSALLHILCIWLSKVSLLLIITLKIVSSLLFLNLFSLCINVSSAHRHRVQNHIIFLNQFVIALKSLWRSILANSRLLLSAEFFRKHCETNKTRSFINKSNNCVPWTEPYGTPEVIFFLN